MSSWCQAMTSQWQKRIKCKSQIMLLWNLHKTCKNQSQVHNLNWVQSQLWLLQQFHLEIKNLNHKRFLIQNQTSMLWLVHCKLWPCKTNKVLQMLACSLHQQVQKRPCQLVHNLNNQLVDQASH